MQEDVAKKHDFASILEAKMKLFPVTRTMPKYGFRIGGVNFLRFSCVEVGVLKRRLWRRVLGGVLGSENDPKRDF